MFRDLKEYQEIAKLYAEKVSKTKDLDENRNIHFKACNTHSNTCPGGCPVRREIPYHLNVSHRKTLIQVTFLFSR